MTNQPAIARVRYYPLQPLRPAEMTDEQAYHVAMRRRHNLAAHPWGILYGLDLATDADGTNPAVRSGLAVDGYGRDLVLARGLGLDTSAFDRYDSETLDVFLQYDRQPATSADTSGESPRLPGTSDREVESPRVVYAAPEPPQSDRRSPRQVDPADLDFGPDRDPPDDPARSWPVFLGQITRIQGTTPVYRTSPGDRPYAGLVGSDVVGPSGDVLLRLGTPSDPGIPRFAVHVAPSELQPGVGDPNTSLSPASDATPAPLDQTPCRLAIDGQGAITLAGATSVAGDLTIDGGALVFGDVATPDPATNTTVPAPGPWSIYRQTGTAAPGKVEPRRQLRIVIGAGGAFMVGAFTKTPTSPKPAFQPSLTVADGTVTIGGNLRISGSIQTDDPVPEVLYDPRAQSAIVGALSAGITGSGSVAGTTSPQAPVELLAQLLDADNPAADDVFRDILKGRPDRAGRLVGHILASKEGNDALIANVVSGIARP